MTEEIVLGRPDATFVVDDGDDDDLISTLGLKALEGRQFDDASVTPSRPKGDEQRLSPEIRQISDFALFIDKRRIRGHLSRVGMVQPGAGRVFGVKRRRGYAENKTNQ